MSTGLITSRRVIFSPSTEIKDELRSTSINITCYNRDGNIVKRVKSEDDGNVEDPEENNGSTDNSGSTDEPIPGGNTSGGDEPIPGGDTSGGDEPIPGGNG